MHAQIVRDVRAEQQGSDLVINYSLETSSPCEVNLYLSIDNGRNWLGPTTHCTGDVGKNINAGQKRILWHVLESREELVGTAIQFKVIANGKKSFEPEMVFVEGGTFQMGSDTGEANERPVHEVTLNSFSIGKYEVTQAQWKAVMGNNPSGFSGCDNCPVENIIWRDVQKFITKLNQKTGRNYRLPTEAEWEFAARGGTKSRNFLYSGSNDLSGVVWYNENSGSKTHTVGLKASNELGIYDMTGNVWEWCSDWYGAYSGGHQSNPTGAYSGEFSVLRGGGWYSYAQDCRSSSRGRGNPGMGSYGTGFRVVLSPVQ